VEAEEVDLALLITAVLDLAQAELVVAEQSHRW
jgi:hypothetical protein